MEKTSYYCDKCKKEVDKSENLNKVTVFYGGRYDSAYKGIEYELCDSCASKIGLIKQVLTDSGIVKEQTTSDKLYDIVAQIIAEQAQI